jgi:general secretion pathway protein A
MYTSFFGLNEKPFTITPDPRYLFMSERHGEGLAHLVYGVTESGGFIQLTGEVGTGKTTLVRTLLGKIPAEVDIALILNPQLTAVEFLVTICEELGIPVPNRRHSTKALVDALNQHLLAAHSRGRRTILLIDEAQNLAEDVLEQLRLLTNLETAKQKLLQIILIAQPELRDKLSKTSLRQLTQRITGRYHLEPLSRDEACQYIDHRLRVAGALTEIFEMPAKREVFRLSGGVPRVMNVICDRALLGAYSRESRLVNKRLVRRAAAEVSGQSIAPLIIKWLVPVIGIAAAMFVGATLWSNYGERGPAAESEISAVTEDGSRAAASIGISGDADQPAAQPADPRLSQLLAESDDSAGITTLLGLWGIEYDPGAGTACEQAVTNGLSCYYQRGSWAGVRQLNRPVVLTLTDNIGTPHHVTLVELSADSAELSFGGAQMTFSIDAVSKFWFGQFMLIWRPPNGSADAISPGMQNENVRWLRQSLAEIDTNYQPQTSAPDYFDTDLEQELIAFQRQNRLDADGLAGQKTQIIINSLLAADGTPKLSANR